MDIAEEDIEARLARPDEYAAVAKLRLQWEAEEGAAPTADPDAFVRDFADWAQRNAATHRCMVLCRKGTVIGMAWLAVVARVPTPANMSRAGGDLQSMYLLPEARGGGRGSLLIAALLDEARQLQLKQVTVQSTAGAKNFYSRNGFIDAPKILQAKLKAKP